MNSKIPFFWFNKYAKSVERDVTSCFENGDSHRSGRQEKSVLVLVHTSVIILCCWNEAIIFLSDKEKLQTAPKPQTVIVIFIRYQQEAAFVFIVYLLRDEQCFEATLMTRL